MKIEPTKMTEVGYFLEKKKLIENVPQSLKLRMSFPSAVLEFSNNRLFWCNYES